MSEIKFNIPEPIRRQPLSKKPESEGVIKQAKDERSKVYWHIINGFIWWSIASIVIYFSLGSVESYYFFIGPIAALRSWYRAIKVKSASSSVKNKKLYPREVVAILASIVLFTGTTAFELPEIGKVVSPKIGTCWSETSEGFTSMACWGSKAKYETVAFAATAETCPVDAPIHLEPDAREVRYTCLALR